MAKAVRKRSSKKQDLLPGMTPVQAMRHYGPPDLLAELASLIDIDKARRAGTAVSLPSFEIESCWKRLWRYVTDELAAQRAFLSWQPTDPTATREVLPPDRCRHVGPPARSLGILVFNASDTLLLDGHELRHVLIHPASPEAALEADVRAWLANEPKRPTYDETQRWAAKCGYSQRKAWAAVKGVASLLGKEPART